MNCDQAFDAMTNATGSENAELQYHLEGCPRCREMREVLAPALDLFASSGSHTADPDWSTSGATSFSQPMFLSKDAIRIANEAAKDCAMESYAPPRHVALPKERSPRRQTGLRYLVGLCLIAVSVGLGAWGWASSKNAATQPTAFQAGECLWTARQSAEAKPAQDAESNSQQIVLSCVACHLKTPSVK
ncbi:MAG: hypothetical protein Tsb009_28490 [Planctomycetaceae bacterium]